MHEKLQILLVEDSENDALLLALELEKGGFHPEVRRVETAEEMGQALTERDFDIVIADYIMPRFSGLEALRMVREGGKDTPFILVSGKIGEDLAVEAIRMGANDYLMKCSLLKLSYSVRRSLEEVQAMRDSRKTHEELDRSLADLKKTSDELGELNVILRAEIVEKERAQIDAVQAKDYLKSVIDSASEVVISVDRTFRVTTWNRTAHALTGYLEKDVLNRSIDKLPVFAEPMDIIDIVMRIDPLTRVTVEFTLITKDNLKKVVRAVVSTIQRKDQVNQGVLFVGKDITPDLEAHGKLIEGMGYLIRDRDSASAIDLFTSLTRSGHPGFLITRTNPVILGSWFPRSSDVEVVVLSQAEPVTPSGLTGHRGLVQQVDRFTLERGRSVVLLDGVHYLITKCGFEGFLNLLFDLDEVTSKNRSILLVRVDPNILDTNRMGLVENELLPLPSQKFEDIIMGDDEYEVLRFVHEENQNNTLVSLKKVAAKFQLSHVTVAKRIESLERDGLLYVKKQGKLRAPYITDKGKALLHKRRLA